MFTHRIQGPGQRHLQMGLWRIGELRISPVKRVVPDFHTKHQESKNALSAMEEIKEVKEKLNDARSKFNVRFRRLDTI